MTIRPLTEQDLTAAMRLVWEVFQEYEAPGYSEAGVREFASYIAVPSVGAMLAEGALYLWGSFDGERLAGVIASRQQRDAAHVSLLFVKPAYHRRGIARTLFETVLAFHRERFATERATVNASPYAAEAYRRLGFHDVDEEQTVNGIRFVPMEL